MTETTQEERTKLRRWNEAVRDAARKGMAVEGVTPTPAQLDGLLNDADRLAEAEAILRALQPHIRAMEIDLGYAPIFSDRINAFLLGEGE